MSIFNILIFDTYTTTNKSIFEKKIHLLEFEILKYQLF